MSVDAKKKKVGKKRTKASTPKNAVNKTTKVIKVKKKVVKKKTKASTPKNAVNKTTPSFKNTTKRNGHTKVSSTPKKPHKRKVSSIDDAISKFAKIIQEQTALIERLKQENTTLNQEVDQLKNRKPQTKVVYVRAPKPKPKHGPPARALPSIVLTTKATANNDVITNINKEETKNALAALFGAKQTKSKTTPSTAHDNGGVITSISKDDAKNALSGLFAPRTIKKAKSLMALPINDDDDEKVSLSITTPLRLVKYKKLGKIMPVHVVENRMKMDGVPKILIAQLTQHWMIASVPDGIKCVDRDVASPPPLTKEFSVLIEKKSDDDDIERDDELYQKLIALGLKPKKNMTPSRKMKRFHWKKIAPEHIPGTLWMGMDETTITYNKIEFELKFAFKTPRSNTAKKVKSTEDRTGQVYTFILPKRSQNIQIALSRFKRSDSEFKAAVIAMDESVFTVDILEKFIEIAPNEEEQREAEMNANKEDVSAKYFGRSEKFVYQFIDIVDLNLRLELWLFMVSFKEIVSDKQSQIYKLQKGCSALKECDSFKNVLRLLLAWGNHMNGGSHAGKAYGFEMDSLKLLSGIKTMDSQMNMMMYLYKTLYERYPEYLTVMTDLKEIKVCATMETDMLDRTVNDIKGRFELLESTLLRFEEDYLDVLSEDDMFVKKTKVFIQENKPQLMKLKMIHQRTKNKCQQLGAVFNWNLDDHRIEGLFKICHTFMLDLYKARDDVHKVEIEREKRRKKRERKKKKQTAKEQHDTLELRKKKRLHGIQRHKRSIMDDINHRKRKKTIILDKLNGKLDAALMEKSKLIEANNFKKEIPATVKKNKIKRKMSRLYNESVEKVKPVPRGRMRLPSIVSNKELPPLPGDAKEDDVHKYKAQLKRHKRRGHQRRKRTKGWFEKGKEPKVMMKGAYNPLNKYSYKNAYKRGRGISNHEATALSALSEADIKQGQNVANEWQNAQRKTVVTRAKPVKSQEKHKRAQSDRLIRSSRSKSKLKKRDAYSPPNMGIVRLNKIGITKGNSETGKKQSGADLNLPQELVNKGDEFILEEGDTSPGKTEFQFDEEAAWD